MPARALLAHPIHEGWTLSHVGGEAPDAVVGTTVETAIPGTTHTALMEAGLIPDPYLSDNEARLEWMWRCDWRFATQFAATPVSPGERVDLVFGGIDTVATVMLNGVELGRTANMHRSYRFDVRAALASGANNLVVDISSALNHAESVQDQIGFRPAPYPHPYHAIRKMACSFGWDWGPDLQTAGIWKSVRIERWRVARFASVRPLVTVEGTTGVVAVHVEVERAADEPLRVVADVAGHEAEVTIDPGESSAVVRVEVPDVSLWWPAGHGSPVLHELTVELHSEDEALDCFERRIGFRTVAVDVTNEGDGAGFTFVVNGKRLFIKGANWIPDDHLMTRITRERLETRVDQALEANMNLLRVWGGGIYETQDFYDVCDERGVMVWQDFLFACSAYAEGSPIVEEVIAEARENVTRLTPHASLVMYNGSNENIWGWCDWGWPQTIGGDKTWGLKYYEEILPAIVNELDPHRFYTPSSPYSPYHSHTAMHPNDPAWGTVHEWDVWNRVDYSHYRDYAPRFCSEFGFQGPATWATMKRALPPKGFDQDSPIWLRHQKAEDGNAKLNRGFAPHLPGSDDFEKWHWITSLNQARAIQFGIEHYRSWWPRTAGAIVWQLNDCWPVTSWAAIDGDGRRKPLFYALKHAYAPRLLTFQPRGADGEVDPQGAVALIAVNDTDHDWDETLTFTRMDLDGNELAVAAAHLTVPAGAATTLSVPEHVRVPGEAHREILVADAGYSGDDDHVRGLWTFAEDKDIEYSADSFTWSAKVTPEGLEVQVVANRFTRDLTILADKLEASAIVDDALVTLLPGESHTFRVHGSGQMSADALAEPGILVSTNHVVA